MHVGDIHSGSMPCTSAHIGFDYVTKTGSPIATSNPGWNQAVYYQFQQFERPVVYTPGDNEWADCHKSRQFSSGAPLKELASVRELFFAKTGTTLGQHAKRVTSQADAYDRSYPEDSQFVENVVWEDSRVVFATFNMPGGSNNDADPWTGIFADGAAQANEAATRAAADLRWLDATFARAGLEHARAVVIGLQADMWDLEKGAGHLTNYYAVREQAGRSRRQVRPAGPAHQWRFARLQVRSAARRPDDHARPDPQDAGRAEPYADRRRGLGRGHSLAATVDRSPQSVGLQLDNVAY